MAAVDADDALSALAPLLRVRPELQVFCRFGAQWASPHDQEQAGWAPFHLVTAGVCLLDLDGEPPIALGAGDIALLPHGDGHVVRGPTTARESRPGGVKLTSTSAIDVKSNTDRPEAELICGRLSFEQPHGNLARAVLPRVIVLKTIEGSEVGRHHVLLLAIRDELDAGAPGARAICGDLASALLVMVLRAHFHRQAVHDGFLRLLGERQTARVLTAILADPAQAWSLDRMAASAASSRATLVRDFRRLADTTPFDLLSEVRLGIARHSLCASDQSLADIAAAIGYQSQSAFSRAFQRRFGMSPSEARQPPSRSALRRASRG